MKLIDALRNVDRPEGNQWTYNVPSSPVNESLGAPYMEYYPDELDARFKSYPVYNWLCTDTHVGLNALYLDGELVGSTHQSARKNPIEVEWTSVKTAEYVRSVILTYLVCEDDFAIIDPYQDIGEGGNTSSVTSILSDDGFYDGRPVNILIRYDWYGYATPSEYIEERQKRGQSIVVKVPMKSPKSDHLLVQDGDEQRLISVKDFLVPFNLKKETAK